MCEQTNSGCTTATATSSTIGTVGKPTNFEQQQQTNSSAAASVAKRKKQEVTVAEDQLPRSSPMLVAAVSLPMPPHQAIQQHQQQPNAQKPFGELFSFQLGQSPSQTANSGNHFGGAWLKERLTQHNYPSAQQYHRISVPWSGWQGLST